MRVGILGGGSGGISVAVHLSNRARIKVWDINHHRIDLINQGQHDLLPEANLTDAVTAHKELDEAVKENEINVLAVPSDCVSEVADKIEAKVKDNSIMICFSKGFDPKSQDVLWDVIGRKLPQVRPVVFSGPTHAEEIALGRHTGAVIASKDPELNDKVVNLFSCSNFRLETSLDPRGVQLAASLKNPMAIFIGMVEGLNLGDNARALYMHQAFQEMKELGVSLGAKPETFNSLAGLGDFLVTATSNQSRNWTFGYRLGKFGSKGQALSSMNMVVEGLKSAKIAYKKAQEKGLDLKLFQCLYQILEENKRPRKAMNSLINDF